MEQKEKIKHFLHTCKNYVVWHEEDPKNKNKECYFIFIAKKDISKSYSVVHDVLNVYCEELPLKNVSVATKTFMEMNKNKFYFVYLDELEKDDVFFKQKEEKLKENVINILSKRILDEYVDVVKVLETNVNQYAQQAKLFGLATFKVLKDEVKKKLNKN